MRDEEPKRRCDRVTRLCVAVQRFDGMEKGKGLVICNA